MKSSSAGPSKIGILLCTYNGERYLQEQLDSISKQSYQNWHIYASDDGSVDATVQILKLFQATHGGKRITMLEGPRMGPTNHFLSLIRKTSNQCDYFAYCDQDDIWHHYKLERAISMLSSLDPNMPNLYCSSTRYISKNGEFLQNSYIFKKKPSFQNALVQSIAGANTMVFNSCAEKILNQTPALTNLVAHDWWTYILLSGCGGNIIYDPRPSVDYRQHSKALVGENRTIRAKMIRIKKLVYGRYKAWNDENIKALDFFLLNLTPTAQASLEYFKRVKTKPLFSRLYYFFSARIYRQTPIGNIALFLAVIFRKI